MILCRKVQKYHTRKEMIYSRYITYTDASKILEISIEKVHELINKGELDIIKFVFGDVRIFNWICNSIQKEARPISGLVSL